MTTKKVSKKVSASKPKKVPVKKVLKNKRTLVVADDSKSFWVANGQVLNSLVALRDALNKMEKDVYSYHVRNDRSDFSNWVDSVLLDLDCAKDLRKAKTPNGARLVVVRHLKSYEV